MVEFLKLHFIPLVLIVIFLFSCADFERDNPLDPGSINYELLSLVSSSSERGLSSAVLSSSSLVTLSSSSSTTYAKCGSRDYNPSFQFCFGVTIYDKCGGTLEYAPSTQFCFTDNEVYNKCGSTWEYNPLTEQCCGNAKYDTSTQFCFTDNKIYDKCGDKEYEPRLQFCSGNTVKDGGKCSDRTEIFHPDLYECGTEEGETDWIYLVGGVTYENQTYKAVLIGDQTWMAENLNHNVIGSWCYGNQESNCNIYGRLYNWAAAMALSSSCNSSYCAGIQSKHRGICPLGWHIPEDAEWDKLFYYVDGTDGTSSSYSSPTAGGLLKATNGWNDYQENSGNGIDKYGFSALPSGSRNLSGSFNGIGNFGTWWCPYQPYPDATAAKDRSMSYSGEHANSAISVYKSYGYSVRCVKD